MLRALVLLLSLASAASAETSLWPGAEHPDFAKARAAWLSGTDDMGALGRLAELAAGGNVAAQVMLGAVVADGLVPDAVAALPRAERIALTRAPGGLSGTSWLRVAGESNALAHAFEASSSVGQGGTPEETDLALQALLDAGETGRALRMLTTFYNMGGFGPGAGWTIVLRYADHPALRGHGAPLLSGLEALLRDPATGVSAPGALARVEAALDRVEGTGDLSAPLAAVCAARCPSTAGACTAAFVRITGGQVGYLTLSPVEGLVDSATYQASPRFADDLRRRLSATVDRVAAMDACAANLIR
jgi:hypothetical protein